MKKIIIIAFIVGMLGSVCYGQSPSWQWARSAGGTENDAAWSIATSDSGFVYVTGYFRSPSITFGSSTFSTAGLEDFFLVKYDSTGTLLWAIAAGGSGSDEGNSITIDGFGNIYVTGDFSSPSITLGTTTLSNSGSATADIFVAKYNSSGHLLWAKSAGGSSDDISHSITTDISGNVYIGGEFWEASLSFGTITVNSIGFSRALFLAKYTSNGTELWATSAYGSYDANCQGVVADALDNVYITGYFSDSIISFGSLTLHNSSYAGNPDIFIAKYNSSGSVIWAEGNGGAGSQSAKSIDLDNVGNLYITGQYDNFPMTIGTATLAGTGSSNIFLAKYNTSGNFIWAASISGNYDAASWNLKTDTIGNIFLTGWYNSDSIVAGTITLYNSTPLEDDLFLLKYNASAIPIWGVSTGGTINDWSTGVAVDRNSNIYIAGTFDSPTIPFGSTTLSNAGFSSGFYDMYVAKLRSSSNVGIPENNNVSSTITLFPNPTSTTITITSTNLPAGQAGKIESVKVFDILGGVIRNYELGIRNGSSTTIDISSVAKGIYFVEIKTEREVVRKKIVKQ